MVPSLHQGMEFAGGLVMDRVSHHKINNITRIRATLRQSLKLVEETTHPQHSSIMA